MDDNAKDPPETTGHFHARNIEVRELRSPTVRFDIGHNQAGLVVFSTFSAMFVGFGVWYGLSSLHDFAHKCDEMRHNRNIYSAINANHRRTISRHRLFLRT